MQSATIIFVLVTVIILIILYFLYNSLRRKPKLSTDSIVIIDGRGQHVIDEKEFVRFMGTLENIFSSPRTLSVISTIDSKNPRKVQADTTKYIDRAAEELKRWIQDHDQYPWKSEKVLADPISEEIEGMQGENNHLLFSRDDGKSYDGPHINKNMSSDLSDIARHIKQIKETHIDQPENERKAVNLTATHKLLQNVLASYHVQFPEEDLHVSNSITENVAAFSNIPKLKKNRQKVHLDVTDNGRSGVVVDHSGFRDDDRLASSANESDRNSAIESMLVKKSTTHAKLTGGRKHIVL